MAISLTKLKAIVKWLRPRLEVFRENYYNVEVNPSEIPGGTDSALWAILMAAKEILDKLNEVDPQD